ncbi:two pore calcium channel protein 1-like isoform X1 [Corvus kubaryi]|uniref:two pore calcium channel protein 1-like isoform X1 n=1 Tax=Corvus kubaryi TaxID=68294 RepID=UPI001C05C62B|nr:two pore calcium channel protein 1-like isoform X1 [Corvus kubaryi]
MAEAAAQDLLLAAAFVSDAQYNRNIPFKTSPEAVRLYQLYNHWMMRTATYFFIFLNLSLALFEEPAVYPLPFLATSVLEVLCLLVFLGRLTHFAKVTLHNVFWKDTKNICIMVAILLSLTDLAIYGVLRLYDVRSIRWSRIVRPIFLINFAESRQIRRAFRSIRNTLPEITYVFLLFMFSLLMFSLMALKLFGERNLQTAEGLPYFRNYLEIVFDLYVLVTTANSPDVMMPAFDFSSWYALFFIAFVIINTYIFMSLFLAVVYNNYKKHLKNEIRKLAYMKRRKMIEAFNLLKEKEGEQFVVREARWKQLVKLVAPDTSSSHRELLLRISDDEQKGFVGTVYLPWDQADPWHSAADKKSFVQLADLLNIQVVTLKIRRHPLARWVPALYGSAPSRLLRSVLRHRAFVWTYDTIILINAIFIALDEESPYISYAEWVFLAVYVLEILLKVYTYEPREFFGKTQFWNWFDTLIIFAALTATILNATLKSTMKYNSQQILDIVFILRVLRLIRIVDSIQRFRVIMNTLINIVPTMLTFGGLTLGINAIPWMAGPWNCCVLCVRYHWHGVIPWENPVLPCQLEHSSCSGMWESSSQGFPFCPWEVLQEQLQQLCLILHCPHGAHCGQPVARLCQWICQRDSSACQALLHRLPHCDGDNHCQLSLWNIPWRRVKWKLPSSRKSRSWEWEFKRMSSGMSSSLTTWRVQSTSWRGKVERRHRAKGCCSKLPPNQLLLSHLGPCVSLVFINLPLETLPWWPRSCCAKTPVFLSPSSVGFAFLLLGSRGDCILLCSGSLDDYFPPPPGFLAVPQDTGQWMLCCSACSRQRYPWRTKALPLKRS